MSVEVGPRPPLFRKLAGKMFAGPAGAVFKGMATIVSGTMVARLIGAAAIPFLTRLYDPAAFGVMAIFTSIAAFLMPLLTLRYVVAIPLPRRDAMAMNVVALTALIALLSSPAIAVLLWFAGPAVFAAMNMEAITPYRWLIVVGLLAGVAFETLSMWATRKRDYGVIARATMAQSATGAAAKLGLGLLGMGPGGLIVGQIFNQSGGVTSLIGRAYSDFRKNLRWVSLARIKLVAAAYKGFPIYRLPSQFVLIAAQQAPTVFVASFYGISAAGQFAVAQMLVSLPVNLLSTALTKAAYGELAGIGKNRPGEIKAILRTVTSRLLIVSSAAAFALFLLAPAALPIILGGEWREAGVFASWLSVYLVAAIIAVPMPAFVNVFDRQREFLVWNVLRAVLVGTLIGCASLFDFSAVAFVALYGFAMLFFQAGVIARTNSIVDREVRYKMSGPA